MIENTQSTMQQSQSKYFTMLFLLYSYFSSCVAVALDILPPFVRYGVFKLFLGRMGKDVLIDYKVYIRYFKNVQIGNHVRINRGCEFYTSHGLGKKIVIGDHVTISPNVKFYSAAQDYKQLGMPDIADNIILEDYCWVCADSLILPGVTIGTGSVIGAGSVVTRDIPAWSVAVGNPAKVIKKRVPCV